MVGRKCQKFIGLTKAVNWGQFTPYNPLKNGRCEGQEQTTAKVKRAELVYRVEGILFTFLGIEAVMRVE